MRLLSALALVLLLLPAGRALGQAPAHGVALLARHTFPEDTVVVRAEGTRAYHLSATCCQVGNTPTDRVLRVVDTADPAASSVVSTLVFGATVVSDLAVANGYGYVATGPSGGNHESKLRVLDLRWPGSVGSLDFLQVGVINGGRWPSAVAAAGQLAFALRVGDGQWGVEVIDASRPEAPRLAGAIVWQEITFGTEIAAAGTHVYVADWDGMLRVVDVANAASPTQIGSLALGGGVLGLAARAPYLYALVQAAGEPETVRLIAVDVSDARAPRETARSATVQGGLVPLSSSRHADLAATERYAYVAAGTAGVTVFDLADPARPAPVTSSLAAGDAQRVAASGDRVYVGTGPAATARGGGLAVLRFPAQVWRTLLPMVGQAATPLWRQQRVPGVEGFARVDFVDAQHGWSVGNVVVASRDGGATWVEQPTGATSTVRDVAAASPSVAWLVGDAGLILKTEDGGATWRQQSAGTDFTLQSVDAVDASTAWAVGSSFRDGRSVGVIVKTSDGGATWVAQGPAALLYAIDAVDGSTAWATGANTTLKTADGGATWEFQKGGGIYLLDVAAASARVAWAVAAGGQSEAAVFKTEDGGTTWVGQRTGVVADLSGVAAASESVAWVVGGVWTSSGPGVLLGTTDGGATWRAEPIGTEVSRLEDVDAVSPTAAWAVGRNGTILTRDQARAG